jgi:protein TonB
MRRFNLRTAIGLSLGIHLVLALFIGLSHLFQAQSALDPVTIDIVTTEPESPTNKRTRPDRIPKTKQIVEQDEKLANKEKPIKEAFLSAKDQRVEKETVARERGEFRNLKDSKSAASAQSVGKNDGEKKQARGKATLKDLMAADPTAELLRRRDQQEADAKGGDQQVKAGADASRTNDYLKDTDQGLETMLNTREFKYFTYYSRIRRQLSQYWEPKVKEKMNRMFKQGRRIASDQDHITKLLITLNEKGNLVKVQVVSESGVSDLDEAATEAFRSAAPFPNPPKGIVEGDGTVKIRWDFVLES